MPAALVLVLFLGMVAPVGDGALAQSTSAQSTARQLYWVYLTAPTPGEPLFGGVSDQTRLHRARLGLPLWQTSDYGPSGEAIRQVQGIVPVRRVSRWLSAVSVNATADERDRIAGLPGVVSVSPFGQRQHPARLVGPRRSPEADETVALPAEDTTNLSLPLQQIGAGAIIRAGLTGRGVRIGLIDAGFENADRQAELRGIFQREGVEAARDFILPEHTTHFYRTMADEPLDDHGTEVLTRIGGLRTAGRHMTGLATGATYILARTDHATREARTEEDNWLMALEWMDSLGVQLINSSLGYALGFDDPAENYQPRQMDGQTSVVSRAVRRAVTEKGITVVISGGNDGDNPAWRIISTPADAPEALSIASTMGATWLRASYSGMGPNWLAVVKPDVAVHSSLGTSFAAPVITGLLGCLMQAGPGRKPTYWQALLKTAGHLAGAPNNYLGYGVPSAPRCLELVRTSGEGSLTPPPPLEPVMASGTQVHQLTGEPWASASGIALFHKEADGRTVIRQQAANLQGGRLRIERAPGAALTTVVAPGGHLLELRWPGASTPR